MGEEALALAPTFCAVLEDRTMLTLLNVMLPARRPPEQLHYQSVKLQINAGHDACFPLHFDSDAELDGRATTIVQPYNNRIPFSAQLLNCST